MARFGIDWKLPDGWEVKTLGEVCRRSKEKTEPKKSPDRVFNYVGLENIESGSGELVGEIRIPGSEIRSAKTPFTSEHVLYGKLRPYLNKVLLPDLDGICSTDIWVLIPDTQQVLRNYLGFFLRSKFVVDAASAQQVGINLPRVRPDVFDQIEIPLPPLEEQARIVAKLERIERARRAQKQAIEQTQALLKAALAQVFDTKESLPKGWKVWRLEDATSEIYRYPSFYNILYEPDGVAVIRGEHIDEEGHFNTDLSAYSFISRETNTRYARTILKTDDLVMSVRGTIGKIGYVDSNFEGANITANLLRIAPREGVSLGRFLWYLLRSELGQSLIGSLTTGTTLQTIKAGLLKEMQVPLPPLSVQQRIVAKLDRIQQALKLQREALQKIDALMQSALHRAFRGEL